ncbi:MAG: 2-C-methyl-D-erythritol 2,4-cyclodiphosphate synthase [Actinomycetota bacterium]|nr:2-C-methyl-D-erythritol 2,4-cyclodiphosphate synthase [Actinomycetota bacterium]MDH5223181.1 2-C-methyl-D-erythritol 2,4-cyclodiphosphate synthase [Actinomycetota bacterium]MDH5312779.1 2-C-methyl-D-erythritol 2,4-cyclodiphosphate synthase [Actinomycetota bacterium]
MGENSPRVGIGVDLHRWASDGRELWLGGVLFEGERGLVGHSDGDAICHALADALLGAAALGDVGQHFPDDDQSIAGISGMSLLGRTVHIVRSAGFSPRSCDATVICDHPVIAPRREELRSCLARALELPIDAVSVKATRPEGLGLAGDGVGCMAVAVLE